MTGMPLVRYETHECPFTIFAEFAGQGITCGIAYVPENRTTSATRFLELAVARLPARHPQPQPDPIIYLAGGPGGSAIASYPHWMQSPLRDEREIILIDQRGAGFSAPSLDCVEMYDFSVSDADVMPTCRARLIADGLDLSAYHSQSSAADVVDVLHALNIQQVNVIGLSYGSRLALTIMRDNPSFVRSAILDAVYPPSATVYGEQPANAYRAMRHLFDLCARDDACNAAYPDLEQMLIATVTDLNANPMTLTLPTGQQIAYTGDDVVRFVYESLYEIDRVPILPGRIAAAFNRDAQSYANFGRDQLPPATERHVAIDGHSEGLFISVICTEEIPFVTLQQAEEAAAALPPALVEGLFRSVRQEYATCDSWQLTPAPPIETQAVYSDVPTLLFSGGFDPITPPHWAESATTTLTRSYAFVFPYLAHGALGLHPCPTQIAHDFINDPHTPPDSTCMDAMPPPAFYVPQTTPYNNAP